MVNLFPAIREEQYKLYEEEASEVKTTQDAMSIVKGIAASHDMLLSEVIVRVIESSTTFSNSIIFPGPTSGF